MPPIVTGDPWLVARCGPLGRSFLGGARRPCARRLGSQRAVSKNDQITDGKSNHSLFCNARRPAGRPQARCARPPRKLHWLVARCDPPADLWPVRETTLHPDSRLTSCAAFRATFLLTARAGFLGRALACEAGRSSMQIPLRGNPLTICRFNGGARRPAGLLRSS